VTGDFRESGRDGALGEVEPALRGGGLPLPGLKHWRLRRRLSQKELARRADLANDHLFKIESGRRGCNPETAQLLADLLNVNLQDLRRKYDDDVETKVPPKPSRSKIAYRNVHQAYLRILLDRAVGSAYAAMDEWEIEEHCKESSWEEVIEAVWARKREIEFLGEVLEAREVLRDPDLPEDVRSFLEAVLDSFPDLDIHLLALARRGEPSEEGHEALTKAMRDLL
jgi:transcriptional regulator with XRE-family HTH domain